MCVFYFDWTYPLENYTLENWLNVTKGFWTNIHFGRRGGKSFALHTDEYVEMYQIGL